MNHYQNEAEIEAMIQGFESCTTGKDSFSHADHLATAVWYLRKSDEAQALNTMREGLLRFLNHHGIGASVYNETITRFWILILKKQMDELPREMSVLEVTNDVVEKFVRSGVVFEYYSKELLNSAEAKKGWVEPDLKKL
jgi:hypothetical protein